MIKYTEMLRTSKEVKAVCLYSSQQSLTLHLLGLSSENAFFFYQKDVISETINITLSLTSREMLYFYHRFATSKIITREHIHAIL